MLCKSHANFTASFENSSSSLNRKWVIRIRPSWLSRPDTSELIGQTTESLDYRTGVQRQYRIWFTDVKETNPDIKIVICNIRGYEHQQNQSMYFAMWTTKFEFLYGKKFFEGHAWTAWRILCLLYPRNRRILSTDVKESGGIKRFLEERCRTSE